MYVDSFHPETSSTIRANAVADVSMVTALEDHEALGEFFKAFALPQVSTTGKK